MRRSAPAFLLVVLAGLGVSPTAASPAAPASFANSTGVSVPASGAGAPYPSSITVSGLTGQLVKVTVTLIDLSHGHAPDLDVLLVGPGGQTVLLLSDCCNPAPATRATLTFDDFGRRLTAESAIASATIKPVNFDVHTDTFPAPAPAGPYGTRLSVFNGTDPNGTWRLFVHDDQPGHEGSIAGGWSLTLHTRTTANAPPAARLASTDVPASSLEGDAVTSRAPLAAPLTTVRSVTGSPTSSGTREALACLRAELEPRRVYSRGHFGAWLYEVSNQDHRCMQGVEAADRILGIGEEVTIARPGYVNAGAFLEQ